MHEKIIVDGKKRFGDDPKCVSIGLISRTAESWPIQPSQWRQFLDSPPSRPFEFKIPLRV